jgi:hypothetical protein
MQFARQSQLDFFSVSFQYFPTPSRYIWLPYLVGLLVFFALVKYFNAKLHDMFDSQECIEEEEEDEGGDADDDDVDDVENAAGAGRKKNALNRKDARDTF